MDNYLTTSAKMMFFWLSLSTKKCNGVPFTHICEWKRWSPSSRSVGSFGWIVTVTTIAVGSASMIYPLPVLSELDSELGFGSLYLILATNDCFEWHSSILCQGILWKSQHFPVSFVFLLPLFSYGLDWFSEGWLLGPSLPYFGCCRFTDPNSHFFWCLNFFSILTTYR